MKASAALVRSVNRGDNDELTDFDTEEERDELLFKRSHSGG